MSKTDNTNSNEKKTKRIILESLKKQTKYMLNKPVLEDTNLYYYIKDFFRNYLNIESEVSFEEIINKLEKTYIPKELKQELIEYINKVKHIEYEYTDIDEENIKKYVTEFFELAKQLPSENVQKENFFTKLLKKIGLKKQESDTIKQNNYNEIELNEGNQEEIINEIKQETQNEFENQDSQNEQETIKEENDFIPESEEYAKSEYEEDKYKENTPSEDIPQNNENKKEDTTSESLKETLKNVPATNDFTEDIDIVPRKNNSTWAEDVPKNKKTNNKKEEDIYSLIEKAKKLTEKDKLVDAYKKINSLYEKKGTEEKSKIYPELLNLYEKITKNEN